MDYEEFVRAWQTSFSVKEVAEKMGVTKAAVSSLAGKMRERGVPLKDMRYARESPTYWEKLRRLAEELSEELSEGNSE